MTDEEGRTIYYNVEHALALVRDIRSQMQSTSAPDFIQRYGKQAERYLTELSVVYWPCSDEYQQENSEE